MPVTNIGGRITYKSPRCVGRDLPRYSRVAELVDAALHGGTESYMSAAFKIRTGSNPVPTTKIKFFNNY